LELFRMLVQTKHQTMAEINSKGDMG